MPCYNLRTPSGEPFGILCGDLGPPCACCGAVADFLCDYPVGEDKTCDRQLCIHCAAELAPQLHYCPSHLVQWRQFEASGGVRRVLENVTPYHRPGPASGPPPEVQAVFTLPPRGGEDTRSPD